MSRRTRFPPVFVLLLLLLVFPISIAQGAPPSAKIEPALRERLAAAGRADFIARFVEQADLSPAFGMNWHDRGWFVYETLRATAARSQARAIDDLKSRGLDYQSFIAGNELYVYAGDLAAAAALAALPEVAAVALPRTYYVDPLLVDAPREQPLAFTWAVLDVKADQFWSTFGLQGEGSVVSNIDTGVAYQHPALDQAYKCPSNPGDPACWFDPTGTCPSAPCDDNGHGTATMGPMVADDDPSLTYQAGVAPGAQWIACKGCSQYSCGEATLNACADWILAPGGSPDNRPSVVHNAWGGAGCNPWFLGKVQAWVAAGIFPAFSPGGSGPSCATMGSPADYQESFAGTAHDSSRNIAPFASRGPSCYGHDPYTKPNISAPGVSMCVPVPPDGWNCGYSGTSFSAAFPPGVAALLWSCAPALRGQVYATFEALQNTADTPPAGNCGAPPDNEGNYTYGYGYLNALAAGLAYCGGNQGVLDGHVYEAGTGNPLVGATVTAAPGPIQDTTDTQGYYSMTLNAGDYTVTAALAGYSSEQAVVEVWAGMTTTQDFTLTYLGQWLPSIQPNCFDLTRIDAEYYPATGLVYILGGRSGTSTVGNIYAFDPVNGTCVDTGDTMPNPISNYTVNLVNDGAADLLCTFGGRQADGTSTLNVQCYDPLLGQASVVADLPTAYTGYTPGAQVVVANRVYIFGGFNSLSAPYEINRTDRYNPVTHAFTQIGNLSLARSYIMAAVVDGAIYAFGGTIYDGTNLNAQTRTEKMADPGGAGVWDNAAVAELPQAGAEGRAFGFQADALYGLASQVVLAPAYAQWPGESAAVISYDTAANAYNEAFPDLNTARRDNAGVFIPLCSDPPTDGLPAMWVMGGRSGSDNPPYAGPEYYPLACAAPRPPEAAFSSNSPVCLGEAMEFTDESTGIPPVNAWYWDLGDGVGFSTAQNPIYTYTAPGDYEVTLWVTNTVGSDWVTDTVTVNPLPDASFVYTPARGLRPLTVYFTDTSAEGSNPTWSFGDGETGAGSPISHTYVATGTFGVLMTVTNDCGADTAAAAVEVYFVGPPVAAFTADRWSGFAPLDVQFTDLSQGSPPITSWTWDFDDGGTSTATNPLHTFALTGAFDVLLTVENLSGTASVSHTVEVWPPAVAGFEQNVDMGYIPLPVYFTNTSLYAISPTWSFGDGSPLAYGDHVSHTYVATGTFDVVLTVASFYSEAVVVTATGTVTAYAPGQCIPVAIVTVTQTPAGCQVDLAAALTGSPPFTYSWDLGAFGVFDAPTPTVHFPASGTYPGTLTVVNCAGAGHDTFAFDVTVTCAPGFRVYLPLVWRE